MILTCPECSTRYMAKAGTIDANGRSVRCARCETVWFVESEDLDALPDALALEDNEAVLIAEEPEIELQPELPFIPDTSSTFAGSSAAMSSGVGAHTKLRDKVDAEKLSKRRRVIQLIWAGPLLLLVGAASLAFIKRQAIVDHHPAAATVYQAVGLNVKSGGLDIGTLKSETLVVDGNPILRVTGEVRNISTKPQDARLLQLRLENRSGEPVAEWFVNVGDIDAGGTSQISTDYPAPPIDGVNLRYRLTDE